MGGGHSCPFDPVSRCHWVMDGYVLTLLPETPGTRVPVQIPDGYPGTKIPESPSTKYDWSQLVVGTTSRNRSGTRSWYKLCTDWRCWCIAASAALHSANWRHSCSASQTQAWSTAIDHRVFQAAAAPAWKWTVSRSHYEHRRHCQ